MINVGVVGCGAIGTRRHIPELTARKDAKIVAFCDIVESRAKASAEKYGSGKTYAAFDAFLKHPGMQAVVLAVPNALHAPMTIAALKAGMHVLVEKPMATTREEGREMIRTAREVGKFLMVGQNQRLDRAHQKAREILASGRLGKVLSFRTAFQHRGADKWCIDESPDTWFHQKKLAVMGVCGDLGIHKADLMRYLLNEEFVEVSAQIGTRNKRYSDGRLIDVDDNAMMLLRTQSGVMGTIIISWTNYGDGEANYTVIYCEKGAMMISVDPVYRVVVRYENGEEERYKVARASTNTEQVRSGVMDMFLDSILSNTPPAIDGEEGFKSLEVILTAFDSDAQKRTLPIGGA
jgi:UDP-N-acetylglucosamine 3-dehydrogenase